MLLPALLLRGEGFSFAVYFNHWFYFRQPGFMHHAWNGVAFGIKLECIILDPRAKRRANEDPGHSAVCHGIAEDCDVPVRAGWGCVAIAGSRFDADRNAFAAGDCITADIQMAAAASLQPPVFGSDQDRGHLAAFEPVSGDFPITRLDQDAARTIETEIAVFDDEAVANPTG